MHNVARSMLGGFREVTLQDEAAATATRKRLECAMLRANNFDTGVQQKESA